jgi:hypothetical protein
MMSIYRTKEINGVQKYWIDISHETNNVRHTKQRGKRMIQR